MSSRGKRGVALCFETGRAKGGLQVSPIDRTGVDKVQEDSAACCGVTSLHGIVRAGLKSSRAA